MRERNTRSTNWKRALIATICVLMAVTTAVSPALGQAGGATNAQLTIEQPRYISDPVGQTSENGTQMYVARGQYLEIRPTNFNISDVTSFSVREDEATLTFDKQATEYVLNSQGNAGTFHVRWTVSEPDGARTYTAAIRVAKADYTTVGSEQYAQLQKDAKRGREVIDSIAASGDPDKSVDEKVAFGNQVRNFANDPFSAFKGQFIGLQTLRFMTPAGWVDLGITILLVYALTRGLYSTIARLRKQLEKEEQVSRREDQQYLKMYKSVLSGKQITDVDGIDDHQVAVLEERLGTNLYTALQNFWKVWGTDSLKRMYADAMGAVGYSVRVTRNKAGDITDVEVLDPENREPMADGGENAPEDGADTPIYGPHRAPSEDPAGDTDTYGIGNAPTDVLETLTWEQIDDRVFQNNPDISAVDYLMVANREGSADLISELNISIPEDFQSRQNFMEAIGRFIQTVQESEFTDEHNVPKEDRAVLNNVMAFTTVLEQEYDIPLDLYWRACVWNADGLSRDDEAQSVMDDITDAGSLSEDINTPGGGFGGDSVGS